MGCVFDKCELWNGIGLGLISSAVFAVLYHFSVAYFYYRRTYGKLVGKYLGQGYKKDNPGVLDERILSSATITYMTENKLEISVIHDGLTWVGEITEQEHDIFHPHRDQHYILIVLSEGNIKLMVDFTEHEIKSPQLLIITPGQVHQIFEAVQPHGWAISFDPAILMDHDQSYLKNGIGLYTLSLIDDLLKRRVYDLAELMYEIQISMPNILIGRSVQYLIFALIDLINGARYGKVREETNNNSRGFKIEKEFRKLLELHYKEWKKPAEYAEALFISVAHLNDTVRDISGNTVSLHIQQQNVLEAKRLLLLSDLPVKEIAYELGYNDPVYFSKLFRKITKLTPVDFRQKIHDQSSKFRSM